MVGGYLSGRGGDGRRGEDGNGSLRDEGKGNGNGNGNGSLSISREWRRNREEGRWRVGNGDKKKR